MTTNIAHLGFFLPMTDIATRIMMVTVTSSKKTPPPILETAVTMIMKGGPLVPVAVTVVVGV